MLVVGRGKLNIFLSVPDYPEFIARVTSHIPDKGRVMIRYYGLYSNAHRGKIRKTEVDPLLCPSCGGRMSIIAFIEDYEVIDKIIDHIKLAFMAEQPPPPQSLQQELLMAAEERGEYF